MKKQTKSDWQKHLVFAAIASLVFMFAMQTEVAGQMEIQYNALYECPRYPHNFKVLSSPNEKNYRVLFVNLYTPSASFQTKFSKRTFSTRLNLATANSTANRLKR